MGFPRDDTAQRSVGYSDLVSFTLIGAAWVLFLVARAAKITGICIALIWGGPG